MIPNNPENFEMKLEKHMTETPLIWITNIIVASLYVISGVSHFDEAIIIPIQSSQTNIAETIYILFLLSIENLIHALSYFYTLKHFPSRATSAAVLKGL